MHEGKPIPTDAPKEKAIKALINMFWTDKAPKSKVAIAPSNGHKYKDLVLARGRYFEPIIAVTAAEAK